MTYGSSGKSFIITPKSDKSYIPIAGPETWRLIGPRGTWKSSFTSLEICHVSPWHSSSTAKVCCGGPHRKTTELLYFLFAELLDPNPLAPPPPARCGRPPASCSPSTALGSSSSHSPGHLALPCASRRHAAALPQRFYLTGKSHPRERPSQYRLARSIEPGEKEEGRH
jgi:hypothetical protein